MASKSAKSITLVNPSRRGKVTARELREGLSGTDQVAYKGYLIRLNSLQNLWNISKDKFHIGSNHSLSEAKKAVDLLTGPVTNPKKRKRNPSPKKLGVKGGWKLKPTRASVKPLAAWVFNTVKEEGKINTELIEHSILDFLFHVNVIKIPYAKIS